MYSLSSLCVYYEIDFERLRPNLFGVLLLEKLSNQALQNTFGGSMEFTKSAGQILSSMKTSSPHELLSSLEAAKQVAGCSYEYGTLWGRKVRFIIFFSVGN